MWGINPISIAQIFGGILLKDAASSKHGIPKMIRDKIIVHVAQNEISLARSLANSIAQQDKNMYSELKNDLHEQLPEKEWRQIFNDLSDYQS